MNFGFGWLSNMDFGGLANINFGGSSNMAFGGSSNMAFGGLPNIDFGRLLKMNFGWMSNMNFGELQKVTFGSLPCKSPGTGGQISNNLQILPAVLDKLLKVNWLLSYMVSMMISITYVHVRMYVYGVCDCMHAWVHV